MKKKFIHVPSATSKSIILFKEDFEAAEDQRRGNQKAIP